MPLYLRVLGLMTFQKTSYLAEKKYALERVSGRAPLYLRVLGFWVFQKASHLSEKNMRSSVRTRFSITTGAQHRSRSLPVTPGRSRSPPNMIILESRGWLVTPWCLCMGAAYALPGLHLNPMTSPVEAQQKNACEPLRDGLHQIQIK